VEKGWERGGFKGKKGRKEREVEPPHPHFFNAALITGVDYADWL